MATRRDALDEPADLTIDRVDLLEILALFGLQRRMLLHHLAQKRVLLPLLLLLRLLSYQWLYVHLLQFEVIAFREGRLAVLNGTASPEGLSEVIPHLSHL